MFGTPENVKVIQGTNDPEFILYEDAFYNNFNPDDWDYMIIGTDSDTVDQVARELFVCDYAIKLVNNTWMAVTYHS